MKTLLLGLLITGSFSCFAQDSEFERGYEAGKVSCAGANESWYCTIPEGARSNIAGGCYDDEDTSGSGRTKSEATLQMSKYCLGRILKAGKKPVCSRL